MLYGTLECPPEFRSSRCGEVATNKQGKVTISILANMRTKLNETKDRYVFYCVTILVTIIVTIIVTVIVTVIFIEFDTTIVIYTLIILCINIITDTFHRYRTAQTKVEATKSSAYRLMDLVEARRRYKAEGTKCIHWRFVIAMHCTLKLILLLVV